MKHHRKRWVRRNRHKNPELIVMHCLAAYIGRIHPFVFCSVKVDIQPRRKLVSNYG